MSRLTKTIEIEGRSKRFEIHELKVKEIMSLMSADDLDDLSITKMMSKLEDTFLPMCSNITMDDINDMAPSEVLQLWEVFREVNASFFVVLKKLGMADLVERMKAAILEDFGNIAVASSKQDTLE